jgi:hypothetical protein
MESPRARTSRHGIVRPTIGLIVEVEAPISLDLLSSERIFW